MKKSSKKKCHACDAEPPAAKYFAINSYREEGQSIDGMEALNDASGSNTHGRPGADIPTMELRNSPFRIGTWNVRTLAQKGKFDNLLLKIKSMNIYIYIYIYIYR